ncbi:hypothetical protein ACQP3D_29885, partial [Escherichia coli]
MNFIKKSISRLVGAGYLPSIHKALGAIPAREKKNKNKKNLPCVLRKYCKPGVVVLAFSPSTQ